MQKRLIGKVALITGGNSGIGRATALEMAREGATLALVARNRARLEEVVRAVREMGVEAEVFAADTTRPEEIGRAISDAIARFGRIDIAHLNAGTYLRCPAAELSVEQIRAMMENNFFGTLNTLYPVLRHMRDNRGGSVVTTISMDGKKGIPPDAAYVATKFALTGFMQVLRQEMKGSGVHVGAVFPSRTDTPQIAHIACPRITPKAAPEVVARAVVRCVVKRKREVLVPFAPCKFLALCDAISPALGDFLVRALNLAGEQSGEPIV